MRRSDRLSTLLLRCSPGLRPVIIVAIVSLGLTPTLVVAQAIAPANGAKSAITAPSTVLDGSDGRDLALENFRPKSTLVVPEHHLKRAKFPVVDVHVHPKIRLHHSPEALDTFVRTMDAQNIAVCVSLDGGLEAALEEHSKYVWTKYRDRFVIFSNIDWRGDGKPDDYATWDCHRPDFARRMVAALERAKERGVSGLKVFKDLGLVYKNPDGSYIKLDDPRWSPIWEACGKLGLPVIIHSGDPPAFFQPIDARNERWEELHRHPEWSFYGPQFPTREECLAALLKIVERHPQTTFIGAHVASNSEDLKTAGTWLDKYPNLVVEIASRISELGRQPYTARKFFLKYADRIMFGTDGPRVPERLFPYWRFLETDDEYFAYAENPFPPQGFWNIYGIYLPDDVLKKVYHKNAVRIIPGVREKLALRLSRDEK